MHASLVGLADLRRLPAWKQWQALTAAAPPFLGPEFFVLAAPLSVGSGPIVAHAWDGDSMIGALPLVRDGDRLLALRCDYSPGYDYCGNLDGIAAIWRALRADPDWSELVLGRVPATSPLATMLPALAASDGCPSVVRVEQPHLFLRLPRVTASMSSKFRANLERCERKVGGVELERIAVPTSDEFDQALAIEAMAWKGAAGTSIDTHPQVAHLFRALTMLVGRRGQGALYFLRAGGKRIAMLLAVEDQHTLYALKIGYDPAFANVSPGHLMVWKVAMEAEARGLGALDFVGRADEWKRKWTSEAHEHVTLVIYRDNVRGLLRYATKVLVRPHLPETLRDTPRSPLPRTCQRADIVGDHRLTGRIRGRVLRGLGIRSGLRRLFKRAPAPPARLGTPSVFAAGAWVRVKAAPELRATLDGRERTRGLLFTKTQWDTVGQVYRVAQLVRRLRDDRGRFRPVSHTVLLEDVDCAGHSTGDAGCGRHCPMMYRDEWLEPAVAEHQPPAPKPIQSARVRDLAEIVAGLDLWGRRDGLTFMPEMRAYVGKRFSVASQLNNVFEYDRWIPTRAPVYILGGLHCTGAVVGTDGPCERACALLWHRDWLQLDQIGGAR